MRNPSDAPTPPSDELGPVEPTGTKLQIIEAALSTLRSEGYAGASARAIARSGGFNQALIFYHFGSVRNLLLAVLDLISQRRMQAYAAAFEGADTAAELAALAQRIHADDLRQGYITVLGEMVAGGITDGELGAEVAARIEPWITMVEHKITRLLRGSPLAALAAPRDLAFGLVALYFGADMLGHLQRHQARPESLLQLATRLSVLIDAITPARPRGQT